MAFLTVTQVLSYTDHIAGGYDAASSALTPIAAKLAALETFVYGDGTSGAPSLGDPNAIVALGPGATAAKNQAQGASLQSFLLTRLAQGLSSYLLQWGPSQGPGAGKVTDVASLLRYANGCPDPTPAGAGAGSSYANLVHPDYAAFISTLTLGGSVLPPDVVFAPDGLVLASYDAAAAHYAAGATLMTPGKAPYAPAAGWCVQAGTTPPNGSLFVTVTGKNQAGATVSWRGDAGTGLTAVGQRLAATALLGTAGGSGGGTAAPTDRLVQVTNVARDTSVSSGGTATAGQIALVAVGVRTAP